MTINATKREIFLVFVVILLGLLALIYVFLISPTQDKIAASESQLERLETQKTLIDTTIALGPTYRARQASRFTEANEALAGFVKPMHVAEFEQLVFPVVNDNNGRITNSTLSAPRIYSPYMTAQPIPRQMYLILQLIEDYNDVSVQPITYPSSSTDLLYSKFTYAIDMTFNQYLSMLDDIRQWDTTVFVSDTNYDFAGNRAVITFDVFFVDRLVEEEEPEQPVD